MFARVKQMLIKEFLELWRDKWGRFRLIVPPVLQMLLFGYAATFEVYHVSTIVLDLDHTQESRELISRFTSSNRLTSSKSPSRGMTSTMRSTRAMQSSHLLSTPAFPICCGKVKAPQSKPLSTAQTRTLRSSPLATSIR